MCKVLANSGRFLTWLSDCQIDYCYMSLASHLERCSHSIWLIHTICIKVAQKQLGGKMCGWFFFNTGIEIRKYRYHWRNFILMEELWTLLRWYLVGLQPLPYPVLSTPFYTAVEMASHWICLMGRLLFDHDQLSTRPGRRATDLTAAPREEDESGCIDYNTVLGILKPQILTTVPKQ